MGMKDFSTEEEVSLLIDILPERVREKLSLGSDRAALIEVVLDLGRPVEARFDNHRVMYIPGDPVSQKEIDAIIFALGEFTSDNRAGISRTLHRISSLRNRQGKIIGLTCRVGRSIYGTIDIIKDVIESGKNILFMGPPGIGKTTKLREAARILADDFNKRVVVVDTSNEIAGDSDIPHPSIGRARRMQVSSPKFQHAVMIEAVENHMPEVVIVDEIGTEEESFAARTIAERGVQLIGTAHGVILENILKNPTLSDLVGGIQSVILSDEESKRRGTQKAILERKALPTFNVAIEIRERDKFAIYFDVAQAIDKLLRGGKPTPEIRVRTADGKIKIEQKAEEEMPEMTQEEEKKAAQKLEKGPVKIYPFAVNRGQLERAIYALEVPAAVVNSADEADIILTVKSRAKPTARIVKIAEEHRVPLHIIRKNISSQIVKFLRFYFHAVEYDDIEEIAKKEAREAGKIVLNTKEPQDLSPQNAYIRRLQHQVIEEMGLRSSSVGEEPTRHLRIYPSEK